MGFLTHVEIPDDTPRREIVLYCLGHAAAQTLPINEENAASWLWREYAECDDGFAPCAGSIKLESIDGHLHYFSYVDARDVAESLMSLQGAGI